MRLDMAAKTLSLILALLFCPPIVMFGFILERVYPGCYILEAARANKQRKIWQKGCKPPSVDFWLKNSFGGDDLRRNCQTYANLEAEYMDFIEKFAKKLRGTSAEGGAPANAARRKIHPVRNIWRAAPRQKSAI